MKLTTGYDFQGYIITDYIDVLFDEMVVGIGLGKAITSTIDNIFSSIGGSEATEMVEKLNVVKKDLRDRVEEEAKRKGANALIGIDFESSKLGDLIMVSMTATAVKIEKLADYHPVTEESLKAKEIEENKNKEEELRQKQLNDVIDSLDTDLPLLNEFITACKGLNRFIQIREVWEKMSVPINDVTAAKIKKELDSKVTVERMFGGTNEKKLSDFFVFVSNIGEE